jgi:hypothetical protein
MNGTRKQLLLAFSPLGMTNSVWNDYTTSSLLQEVTRAVICFLLPLVQLSADPLRISNPENDQARHVIYDIPTTCSKKNGDADLYNS